MVENGILLQNRQTDWNSLKISVEKLYSNWETIVLDLYKVNINNEAILSFSRELDTTTNAIQAEDKIKTLNSLAKLYSYIPQYSSAFSENTKLTNVYKTKASVLNAYVLLEQDDFAKISEELKNAEQNLIPILNDISMDNFKQVYINKSYILIKDLQGFNANTNKEIFYIKYKSLMQNLNNI